MKKYKEKQNEGVYEDIVRGKWIYDGCKNVKEMIKALKKEINYLKRYDQKEIKLVEKIHDDYAFFITKNPKIAKKLGFHKVEIEEETEIKKLNINRGIS